MGTQGDGQASLFRGLGVPVSSWESSAPNSAGCVEMGVSLFSGIRKEKIHSQPEWATFPVREGPAHGELSVMWVSQEKFT